MRNRLFGLILFPLAIAGLMLPSIASGQDLIDRYRQARFKVKAEKVMEEEGYEAVAGPYAHMASRSDTLRQWLHQQERAAEEPWVRHSSGLFEIDEWRKIRRLERNWFEKRFRHTLWAFLGTESLTPLDTTQTRDLRAQLEAYYGSPTLTMAELKNTQGRYEGRDNSIQFEYWFVLNDSIPLVMIDVNGPLERGLIFSSDQRYREILLDVRETFLQDFYLNQQRAPYVDYFFDTYRNTWYHAGYDGREYFLTEIARPNLALGRPWLTSSYFSE